MFFKTETNQNQANLVKQPSSEELTVSGKSFIPDADIYETQSALIVTLDLPGVKKDQVEIGVERQTLTILGKVSVNGLREAQAVYSEYNVGNYFRQFTLSQNIDKNRITAELSDGVLTLTLPKAEHTTPRRITIA